MPPAGTVLVFRERFLGPSETFIRDHLLHLPSWAAVALTMRRVKGGLEVPDVPVLEPGTFTRIGFGVLRRAGIDSFGLREKVLERSIGSAQADVVHAHFGPDAARVRGAVRRAGLPLVVTFHGYDATISPEQLRKSVSGTLLADNWNELLDEASAVITVSTFLRDELLARGADPERLHVIPCGVRTDAFEWSPPPADGGLLFVGRLVEKKGCSDLLNAVASLSPRPRLRIIGDGPLRAELEQEAGRLHVDAEFLGVRDTAYVRDAMRDASIVVMPSQRAASGDCEGLPVVSLEASAMGRPIMGYAHSGLMESVISGETGMLAPERDIRRLSALLGQALGDPVELQRLARNARTHIERNFELRSCLQRVEDVYEAVTEGRLRAVTNRRAGVSV